MRTSESVYLGFDLGASGGRALLGSLQGRRLKIKEISRFANAPCRLGGRWHWDFLALWNQVQSAMRQCAAEGHGGLSGVGVDTWGVDFGLLGADGHLAANPRCYRDPMTDGIERRLAAALGQEELYRLTGTPYARVSTLSQLVALAGSPAACTLKSATTLLMMPDLFRYYLCGHKAVELTAAGSSQLLDVRTACWCPRLFRAMGIPRRIVPEIVRPATVVGQTARELLASTGVERAPVVAVAGHDTASAAAAAPFAGDDAAFASCGTWLVVGAVLDRPITTPEAMACGFVNQLGFDSVLFVKGTTGLYLFENVYRALRRKNRGISYAQLLGEASQAKPLRALLDVNWPRLFAAEDAEASVDDFLRRTGQEAPRSRGSLLRTLLEGLAWSCRGTIQDLAALREKGTGPICAKHPSGRSGKLDLSPFPLRRISLVGGGARNALLCQMMADATGLEVIAGPAEATAVGNLAIQALATGRLRQAAEIRELVRGSFKLKTYQPRETELWKRHAHRYLEVVERGAATRWTRS